MINIIHVRYIIHAGCIIHECAFYIISCYDVLHAVCIQVMTTAGLFKQKNKSLLYIIYAPFKEVSRNRCPPRPMQRRHPQASIPSDAIPDGGIVICVIGIFFCSSFLLLLLFLLDFAIYLLCDPPPSFRPPPPLSTRLLKGDHSTRADSTQ